MRGSLRQRNRGSWEIRYDGPPEPNGKRKYASETVRGTRKDAERVLRERMAAFEKGVFVPRRNITVAEFLEDWLRTYAASNTSVRTQEGYRSKIEAYIVPALGHFKLQALHPVQIQEMYTQIRRKGLAPSSVLHVHAVLRKALNTAVMWRVIALSPMSGVESPRQSRKAITMWDESTINLFLKLAEPAVFYDWYQLAIHTGLRRSEVAGLKWSAVDLDAGTPSVLRTLQRVRRRGMVEGEPKNQKSRRTLELSPGTVDILHRVRGRQMAARIAAGPFWEETGYVFSQPNGRPIDSNNVSREFAAIVKEKGLPKLTLHGLRHAFATLLLVSGIHPKVVSEMMGHSSVMVTLDIYSHLVPGLQRQAARVIDERLWA